MKKITEVLSVVLILGMSPLTVMAGNEEATYKFEYLDSDGDGFISKSEATLNLRLRERWNDFDVDKDGKLSSNEFNKFASVPDEPFPE